MMERISQEKEGGEGLAKFILGILIALGIVFYGTEIRQFSVVSGARDTVVEYLRSW
jgi:hypothetical protein